MIAQAMDGRESMAWLLNIDGKTETENETIPAYSIVFITAKAATDSAFGDMDVFMPYIAMKELTLKTGDKCIKADPYMFGMAKDKSLNKSKQTQDVTVDADESTNMVTDGIVAQDGSISMAYSVDDEGYASQIVKKRFGDVIIVDAEGAHTVHNRDTTTKDLILFGWNVRNAKAGETIEFEIVPALLNSLSHNSAYNSSQTFDINFNGNATDEHGFKGGIFQIKNGLELVKALAKNRAGMKADADATTAA